MQTIPATPAVPHAESLFGTRQGALENIEKNMRHLAEKLGPIAYMRQVHGDKLTYAPGPGIYEETDAIYTDRPGLWLSVSTADCVPILISSPLAVAVVHAGWRGLRNGLLPKTLQTLMREFGLEPRQLFLSIGPCIRQAHYEVEESFVNDFEENFFKPSPRKGHLLLDLPAIVRAQAREEGIPTDNLMDSGFDTYADTEHFFSYRRSKQKGDVFNVQPSLIRRKQSNL